MTIQYASDLHLEFPENEYLLRRKNLVPKADTLILGGDIVPFHLIGDQAWFFDYVSQNFKTTYWIPGNHEYYHSDISIRSRAFVELIRKNVFLVNNYAVTIENVRLIFATMWTSIKANHQIAIQRRMNDFHLIKKVGDRLTCEDLNEEHQLALAFINRELSAETGKKVVITHHVPTFINYPPEYLGDLLNEAFAVNLNHLILKNGPGYWIYGHHHKNIPDFKIGHTSLVTNQLGYVRNGENKLFSNEKTLDVAELSNRA